MTMKHLLTIIMIAFTLPLFSQSSGWIMDMGDGIYMWNEYAPRTVQPKKAPNYRDEYREEMYKYMVADSKGLEKTLRELGFVYYSQGKEAFIDRFDLRDFNVLANSEGTIILGDDKSRYVISDIKNDGNNWFSISYISIDDTYTLSNQHFISKADEVVKKKDPYVFGNYEHRGLYKDHVTHYLFDYKTPAFTFENAKQPGGTVGIVFFYED